MFRVTRADREDRPVILLEGRLAERWVGELERACQSLRPPRVLDLSGVTFADALGVAALHRLQGQGAELVGASCFVKELLRGVDGSSPGTELAEAMDHE